MTNQGYALGKLEGAAAHLKTRIAKSESAAEKFHFEGAIAKLMKLAVDVLQVPKGHDGAELLRARGYAHLLLEHKARKKAA